MKVLGIESSADDSGIALVGAEGTFGPSFRFKVLGNEMAGQHHAQYGGIYPNVAKNEHIKNLPLLLEKVLSDNETPDAIAVTVGPGLEPCLWAGISFAQKLAAEWNIPVVGVNHLEGHIVMSMMQGDGLAKFEFPVLSLLISGGNTQLVLSREPLRYEVLGKTRDDAAGEAFDKVGRMLGIPYPSGPEISRLAALSRTNYETNDEMSSHRLSRVRLPRPMINEDNFDFSFSGLKTAALRIVEAAGTVSDELKKKLSRELEEAIADVLVGKTVRAVEELGISTVVTGGGVAANTFIRERLATSLEQTGAKLLVCPPALSTDNGLMIALAGYFRALRKEFTEPEKLRADSSFTLEDLPR